MIVDHFGDKYKNAELRYAVETTPLGTGGGLLLAAAKVEDEESFLLLNGDTYFAADLAALVKFARQNDADWCFSMFQPEESGRYMGMNVAPDGRITSLKSGSARPGYPANGGVYWLSRRILDNCRFGAGEKIGRAHV